MEGGFRYKVYPWEGLNPTFHRQLLIIAIVFGGGREIASNWAVPLCPPPLIATTGLNIYLHAVEITSLTLILNLAEHDCFQAYHFGEMLQLICGLQ